MASTAVSSAGKYSTMCQLRHANAEFLDQSPPSSHPTLALQAFWPTPERHLVISEAMQFGFQLGPKMTRSAPLSS